MRKISFRNNRVPPKAGADGMIDPTEERKYQRLTADDLRRDLTEVSQSTPDLRDRLVHVSTGDRRQRIAHKMSYTPELLRARVVDTSDSDEIHGVNEYQEADSTYVFIKTNAPQGAKIVLTFMKRQ